MPENIHNANDINNPNDKFFKAAFSMITIARPLITTFLNKDLLDKLDLETLEIDPNSYINDELKETFSDLVWSCRLKGNNEQCKIAFLLEHKSYKSAYPHFQINDYQRGAWNTQIGAKQKPVPIIPIVFYHGKEKWMYEAFDSYFGTVEPEIMRFLPCFDYILINLTDYSDAQIKSLHSIFLQKTLLAFKHYWDRNYLKLNIVEILLSGYESTINEQTRSFIQIFAVYLTNISGITRQEVIEQAIQLNNNLNPQAMSIIEEFIEIGREKGIEIGIFKAVINLHKKGMKAELIAEYMDIPLKEVKRIIENFFKQ